MKKVKKYYVRFYYPGVIVAETSDKDVDNPDPYNVKWPQNAYCFEMYMREDIIDGKDTYRGKAEQVGPMYYHPDSKVESLAEVKKNRPTATTLIANMECNKWNKIIWTRWESWPQPYNSKEIRVL